MKAGACRSACCWALRLPYLARFAGLTLGHYENNLYAQIGLVMLIGLAAKNAILIVEFAKMVSRKASPFTTRPWTPPVCACGQS